MNGVTAMRLRRSRKTRMLVAVAALGGALAGCSGDSDSSSPPPDEVTTTVAAPATGSVFTDTRFAFNFRYPKGWEQVEVESEPDLTAGGRPTARVAVGFDNDNGVLLSRFELSDVVTAEELPDQVSELDGIFSQFAGRPMSGTVTEVGGIPAVSYEEFALPGDPNQRSSRVVVLFDGDVEYQLNCQSTPEGLDQLNEGCDQMLATLRKK